MMKDFFFFSSLFSLLLLSSLHFGNGQEVVTKPKRHLREEERVQYELTTKFVRQREDRSLSDKYFEPQKKKKEKKQEEEDISFRVEKNFGTDPILSEKRFENVANFPAFRDLCKDGEKSSPFGLGFWANSLRIPVKSYSRDYPILLFPTYPNAGNTLVRKIWEIGRGIGSESSFKEKGSLSKNKLSFGGDFGMTLLKRSHHVNLSREEVKARVHRARKGETVLVKSHHPWGQLKENKGLLSKQNIIGIVSMWRSPIDNYVSCVNHGWCKERDAAKGPLDVVKFMKFWLHHSSIFNIPLIIYNYDDIINNPLPTYRDMFENLLYNETITDEDLGLAVRVAVKAIYTDNSHTK